MSYPWNETFDAAVDPTSYTVLAGSPTIAWNEAEQALDITSTNRVTNLIRFNQPAATDFWYEADIELISCPNYDNATGGWAGQTQRHFGIWIANGNGCVGWRFDHYDPPYDGNDYWNLYHYPTTDFANPALVAQSTVAPMTMVPMGHPAFYVGERHRLRVEYWGHPTRPWQRLMHFYIDERLVWQTQHAVNLPGNTMRPCLFLYEGQIRIHSLTGDTPSGLPDLQIPDTYSRIQRPVEHAISRHGHEPTVPEKIFRNFSRSYTPLASQWDAGTPITGQDTNIPIGLQNIYFKGTGVITGTIKMQDTPEDTPLRRRVQLIDQRTNVVVSETWSTMAGDYQFKGLDTTRQWTVIAFDYKKQLRAVVSDNLKAIAA